MNEAHRDLLASGLFLRNRNPHIYSSIYPIFYVSCVESKVQVGSLDLMAFQVCRDLKECKAMLVEMAKLANLVQMV